ncbi:MAG: ATP-grasp domain-containing protein [Bacteroidetes bacterium]|nr:ATP-grasp domain-containing protein [Bacteroidota bacterium]
MRIIFCDNLIDRKVDPDFEEEYKSAVAHGFQVGLISFEDLNDSNIAKSISRIGVSDELELAIYRGWMIHPDKYKLLYEGLLKKKVKLINSPEEYMTCHYLPLSYDFIKELTPFTNWTALKGRVDFDKVYELTSVFNDQPIIVKDYVKSQKHNWTEACFIPKASDKESVRKVVSNFIDLQGEGLNVGLVFRKFEELEFLTNHSKSQMPLTKEFRLFFLNERIIQVFNYWDEGDYGDTTPDLKKFESIGLTIKSNFFTMDIAKKKDGDWIIMELGDGQVSGLPDNADKTNFYRVLKQNTLQQ